MRRNTDIPVPTRSGTAGSGHVSGLKFRYVARRHQMAATGAAVILLFMFMAILGPYMAPFDPMEQNLAESQQRPSFRHLLGADNLGRDILSRILAGARLSLFIAVASTFIGLMPGVLVGIAVGFYENAASNAVLRFTDVLMAFPGVLLSLALIAVTGGGFVMVVIAVAATFVPGYVRLARAVVLAIKQSEYVQSARAIGAGDMRILLSHILPNSLGPIMVQTSLNISAAILIASSLSFLGLGIDPSLPEWGAMLNAGRDSLRVAPWVSTFPGLAIMLVSLGFNLLGDGLRDILDPRLR